VTTLLFFGIFLEIIALLVFARKANRGHKFLFIVLSMFWYLSFIMRPLIFVYSRNNGIDTAVYDYRIGQNERIFNELLFSIFFGCLIFLMTIAIWRFKSKTNQVEEKEILQNRMSSLLIFSCFACGYAAILIEDTAARNPFSKSLTILVSTVFSAFLWTRIELSFSRAKNVCIFLLGTIGTYILSVSANNSKGILLLPALVFLSTLPVWNIRRRKAARLILAPFIALISIQIFSVLQSNKLGETNVAISNKNVNDLPFFFSPFLILVNRFDQFARVSDVYFAEKQPLGSYRAWFDRFILNLEWNPSQGRSTISFGQEWNLYVTNQSIPGSRLSNVALAQGMIAEGLVWAGFISLIIECIALALIFIWIGKLLDKGPLSVLFAFGIIANGSVFEMGLIQFSQILSGAVKMVAFLWVVKKFHNFLNRSSFKPN
jgi:hypothetical protein